MKLAFLVDGRSEYSGLPIILNKIEKVCIHQPGKTVYVDIQPKSTPKQIAKKCNERIPILMRDGVDEVIVFVDLEDLIDHPGIRAKEIATEIQRDSPIPVTVVMKVRCFENWVIADVAAVNKVKNLSISKTNQRKILPDKADNVPAKKMVSGRYHKIHSSEQILKFADPIEIAAHSRSFRRFLRVLGHELYLDQSKRPKLN